MKKKTEPNIRLLRRIQRAILKKADQFQMMSLFSKTLDNDEEAGGCGTAGCIAGWALHLTSNNKRLDKTTSELLMRTGVEEAIKEAGKLIGVPIQYGDEWSDMKHPLFFSGQWPDPFDYNYKKATTARRMARVASDRIEHFIKTGE